MASSPFTLVQQDSQLTVVYIKGQYDPCAYIYRQSDKSGYRWRKPHQGELSAVFSDKKAILKRIEQEVM